MAVSDLIDGPWTHVGDTHVSISDALIDSGKESAKLLAAAGDHVAAAGWHRVSVHRNRSLLQSFPSAGAVT